MASHLGDINAYVVCGFHRVQEGSEGEDRMDGVAAMSVGGVVAVGQFAGTWNGVVSPGVNAFAAVRLDSDGDAVWRWQVNQ